MAITCTEGEVKISEFGSVRSKQSQTISLQEYVNKVRSDTFKAQVEEYRRLAALPGHEAEAQRVKDGMPCIVPAGVCSGGHAVKNLVKHSGLLQIDMDHTLLRTAEVCRLLCELPYVTVVHKSFSQNGVRAFVRVAAEDVMRNYEQLYAAVGEAVSRHAAHNYDSKCKILTQPSFYSWDANAYYNPDAETFRMQWGEETAPETGTISETAADAGGAVSRGIISEATDSGRTVSGGAISEVTDSKRTDSGVTNSEKSVSEKSVSGIAASGTAVSGTAVSGTTAPGFLVQFLNDFEHRNPFRRGERNDLALKLGRVSRSKGFSKKELEEVISLFIRRYAATDFTAEDIRQRITAGYQFIDSLPQKTEIPGEGSNRVHFPYDPAEPPDAGSEEEDLLEKNNELRAQSPYIPDSAYSGLPQFLKDCVQYASDPRERDIILLGSLNCCSALFPGVSFFYKNALYSSHFYHALVANAAAGKGVVAFILSLLDATQEYYDRQRRDQKKAFEKAQMAWEAEVHQALREHRSPDSDKKPEEPKAKYLKTSSTTSKSRLLEQLATNGELGCHMSSTEINTLISSLAQDYGKYEDILCKAAHHEEISQSYKIDGDPIVVPRPHLALIMSGTPEQFTGFFRSHENGLYSRFLIYTRQLNPHWETCAPGEGRVDLREHFHTLGKKLFEMHKLLLESPTLVTFTPGQWERHTQQFGVWLKSALVEGKEFPTSIVFRHGLLAMRLASILTIFRKWDDYRYAKEYCCTDADFDTAMQIIATVIEHSLLLGTSLPDTGHPPVAMRKFHQFEDVLKKLPRIFSYIDFINAAKELGISVSTAKRYLRKAVEQELVVKQKDKYRKRRKRQGKQGL
ncbi:DUF3987 domain-containing protein [Bacteroides eggerthii]|jgi:hypothetical protein|uniref:DUF3987 domain-containing protein n=2 Tax=Bacteroides eggerthii TaxID=28111 RepID=A0A4Q5H605_9BACE|nr:DUF3987 domain-containing protein [Bacteroides eggerthii]KAA5275200.1 DUF3987 domain-containing protein [Bacteroides eggerthii]RYT76145.1 DUF3987 domain-containing protein [Bacteroides eggerthii]